ncbi:unnamed protein product [Porites lobata]|uniref:Fibronectin type-II domain-containing protein n=1 Tax=Porites lobata TaxID=104759 RepID=A0ABN8NC13_9CNID|nr:unnamed protein product [Porites lobata]
MRVQAQYEALKNSLIFLISVGCVNVAFINKYNKPIRIWKTMSKTRFKGFVVSGKMKKLKTIVANQFKPVVYHAEALDGGKSPQLLLDGQESLSIIPFDCSDKFINITVSPAPGLQQVSDCLESQGGNSNGSCCHFPFLYKGVPQSTCINKDRQVLWCATTDNYDMDNMWGYC